MPHSPRAARPAHRHVRALVATVATFAFLAAPATAQVRDVEVRDVEVRHVEPDEGRVGDGTLQLRPAVSLDRDVAGTDTWPVEIANTSEATVELLLEVRHLAGGEQARPSLGAVVAWADLPRPALVLRPGDVASFTIGLSPASTDLPAAIALVARTVGEDVREARASRVLWPPGHTPLVRLQQSQDLDSATAQTGAADVFVADDAGPSVVDVRVSLRSWPRPASLTDHGPLLLLGPRLVEVRPEPTALGHQVQVVVAIDGAESARLDYTVDQEPGPMTVAVIALVALVLTTLALAVAWRRRRRA